MSIQLQNALKVSYQQSTSPSENNMGMREMQARAYAKRLSQYLLIKAPPACGKSRALMFLALDKVEKQGLNKVIVAVPQQAIGSSFNDANLSDYGFFADWHVNSKYNLCSPGSTVTKADIVKEFMADTSAHYLVCAHATLINFFNKHCKHNVRLLDKTLIAIDEFHHVSADESNQLGNLVHEVMTKSSAHIVAMTGSYFRGDATPILNTSDELEFDKVTYTYYEQLQNYRYLKNLSIDYAFYQGSYTEALSEILDLNKKTIIHIPNVNSNESTKDKYNEVGLIFDCIGRTGAQDPKTGIYPITTEDGRVLRVADLVNEETQSLTLSYLRNVKTKDEVDIIIALGMAKEGFDWPWCEVALTVGYRSSLTEVVQIIGRATRDCEGKSSAQFINLIARPDSVQEDVGRAVNSLLKAITLSLLMQQVLAPNIHFRARSDLNPGQTPEPNTIIIDDTHAPLSPEAKDILANDGVMDITTALLNTSNDVESAIVTGKDEAKNIVDNSAIPAIIKQMYPNISSDDVEGITQAVISQLAVNAKQMEHQTSLDFGTDESDTDTQNNSGSSNTQPSIQVAVDNTKFTKAPNQFINLDEIDINLIQDINPFAGAYKFLSKTIDAPTLRKIQEEVISKRSGVTEDEVLILWPKIKEFMREHGREPNLNATDDYEIRLAECLAYARRKKAERMSQEQNA